MSPLAASGPNAEQIRYWNEQSGPRWVAAEATLDAQIAPLGLAAMERARIAAGERVLDVGCGCGQTTLQLAERVGARGSVTGIDISAPMLERARARASERGFAHVRFVNADAQTETIGAAAFDLVFSRFGVMFFADPVAAFANLRASLAPGGRVVFVCWQELARNLWMRVPLQAAAPHLPPQTPPAPGAPGPFAFADPARLRGILEAAGFRDVAIDPFESLLDVGGAGGTLEQAVELVMGLGPLGVALREASAELRQRVTNAVREALAPHATAAGVKLGSAAWIVRAV
jgi:SAM-dependent methyltransferase